VLDIKFFILILQKKEKWTRTNWTHYSIITRPPQHDFCSGWRKWDAKPTTCIHLYHYIGQVRIRLANLFKGYTFLTLSSCTSRG